MIHNVFDSVRYVVLSVSTVCNLKCKNCITFTPYQRHPVFYPAEQMEQDMQRFFRIFGRPLERLDLGGGEPLLHPELTEFVGWALAHRENNFGQLRILTNGSVRIPDELLSIMKGSDTFFLMDHYGPELSPAVTYNEEVLSKAGIAYRINTYFGDEQYFNGWVDFGALDHKGYTDKQLEHLRLNCFDIYSESEISQRRPCDHLHIKNGRICYCDMQQVGATHIPLNEGDFIDLRSSEPDEQIHRKMETFKQGLIEHCKYCNGFVYIEREQEIRHAHGRTDIRVPAAIQLTAQEMQHLPVECI